MAKKPAARTGDATEHGATLDSSPNHQVFINGKLAWTTAGTAVCPKHVFSEQAVQGADQVFVGGQPAVPEGEFLVGSGPPNRILVGSADVNLGCPDIGAAHTDAYQKKFCAGYCDIKKRWPSMTRRERDRALTNLYNDLFAEFGAPAPSVRDDRDMPGANADWTHKKWRVGLPLKSLDKSSPPSEEALRHEARHGEQTFAALRYALAKGATPRSLIEEGYDPDAVCAAAGRPLDLDSAEGRWARVMHDEILTPAGERATAEACKQSAEAYYARPLGDDAKGTHQERASTPGPKKGCRCPI